MCRSIIARTIGEGACWRWDCCLNIQAFCLYISVGRGGGIVAFGKIVWVAKCMLWDTGNLALPRALVTQATTLAGDSLITLCSRCTRFLSKGQNTRCTQRAHWYMRAVGVLGQVWDGLLLIASASQLLHVVAGCAVLIGGWSTAVRKSCTYTFGTWSNPSV